MRITTLNACIRDFIKQRRDSDSEQERQQINITLTALYDMRDAQLRKIAKLSERETN